MLYYESVKNLHKEGISLKVWMKRILIGLILISALLITFNTDLFKDLSIGDVDHISETVGENTSHIMFITFIIMLIYNAFPVMPLVLVITINNTLLGFKLGFVWGVFTSIICAVIVFLSIRFGFQGMIVKRMNESVLERIERRGFWYVLFARIFPFAPTSIINSVAAVSNIRLSVYTISTLIGNIVIFLIYTAIHSGLVSQSHNLNEYHIASVLIVGVLITYFIKKYKKRKLYQKDKNNNQYE